ncbi:MAG TPA: hypothetical protein VJ951_14035 [Bacteroidales bacterium]|nr:hypothetical protein [Bacteroidales bacterium]
MQVLTVKNLEEINPDIQRDIHYTLRMEHHTDYVFKDKNSKQYASTITMPDTSGAIKTIIEKSTKIPEYTLILENLDTGSRVIERLTVKNGEVIKKQRGEWEWDS